MNEILIALYYPRLKIPTTLWRLDLLPFSGGNGKGENLLWWIHYKDLISIPVYKPTFKIY
jgi:hypothetical protein